jgi:hypothetical protein
MSDEDGGLAVVELARDLEHVLGVPMERCVLRTVIGAEIGTTTADQIEEHHSIACRVRGREEPPHVLVAPKPMREENRGCATA